MAIGKQAGKSIYHRGRNLVLYCVSVQVHGLCLCVCVCAEGIGGRGSVGLAVLGGSSLPYYCHVSD